MDQYLVASGWGNVKVDKPYNIDGPVDQYLVVSGWGNVKVDKPYNIDGPVPGCQWMG